MTHDQFISLVAKPDMVNAAHVGELKEIVEQYPFFAQAHILYAKALQQSNSVLFASKLKSAAIYTSNRGLLYYYMNPEKKIVVEPYRRENKVKSAGDYFDMINSVESDGGDAKQSLRNLAERLKSARAMVTPTAKSEPRRIVPDTEAEKIEIKPLLAENRGPEIQLTAEINDVSEYNAKKLISERKYTQAIEILKALNLNNPKKSVYFADQIRFLEKIIANSKK
jgi:hypothetical protein